jgi:hypothetical protein
MLNIMHVRTFVEECRKQRGARRKNKKPHRPKPARNRNDACHSISALVRNF